jgi:predicted Zn-dependent protease
LAYGLKTTASGKHILWSKDKVIIRIAPEVAEFLGAEDAQTSANNAAEAWRGFPGVPELLVEPGDPEAVVDKDGNPVVGLLMGTPWAYKPNNLAVTVTTYNEATGQILKADVLINPNSNFERVDEGVPLDHPTNYDIEAILVHEFGHLLGLQDNNDEPTATMYPIIELGETSKRSLEEDDQLGVIAAYADGLAPATTDANSPITCQKMSVTGFSNRLPSIELAAFSLAILILARRGVRRHRRVN